MREVRFTIPGTPCAKGRPRLAVRGGQARAYTPAKTVAYEGLVALAGQQAMDGTAPFSGAIALDVVARMPIPASWSRRRREAAAAGDARPTGRPDLDNLLKAIGDGLNGVAYRDDAQIVRASATKLYAEAPGVDVTIEAIGVAPAGTAS